MPGQSPVDLTPLVPFALVGLGLALPLLAWIWWRRRAVDAPARLHALTLLTLFLTFDLVLFGAFTRLTDSGLGCPDWPGCYGHASPLGASSHIEAAQTALPSGPVSHTKAWVEMLHRYLASTVGVLISALCVASWWLARRRGTGAAAPGWASATLAWVCVQGAFGALTVTWRLYPAVVTMHLLGGMVLLALLAAQAEVLRPTPLMLTRGLRLGLVTVAALSVLQIALGGWVSSNYAVLACRDFPTCQGSWWPPMDFAEGFAWQRALGSSAGGGFLPFAALTAIHYTHRLVAFVLLLAIVALALALRTSGDAAARRWASAFGAVALWQLASGLSNVVLGWPMVAALAHTGGAAALVVLLAIVITRAQHAQRSAQRAMRTGWRLAS